MCFYIINSANTASNKCVQRERRASDESTSYHMTLHMFYSCYAEKGKNVGMVLVQALLLY